MLIVAEFPDFSLHLFDDSEFQMESSARFQNRNTERSTKNWFKVFDLWRAEQSEVRKLASNICLVHPFLDAISLIGKRTTCLSNLEIIGLREHPSEDHAVLKYRSTSTLSDFAQILCKVT